MINVELQGLDRMLKVLNTTKDKTVKKMAKAGVNSGLLALTKSMRAAVTAAPVSTAVKRAARKTIGKSMRRYRGGRGLIGGKAGFAVGKPTKKKGLTAHERNVYGQGGAKLAAGVGLSASNIHWFVLGTKKRYRNGGSKARLWRNRIGRSLGMGGSGYTGQIEDVLKGVIPVATASARRPMLEAARAKITQVLARETAKIARSKGL